MKPLHWIFSLAGLLVATNLFWLYQVIDGGVTQTYRDAQAELNETMYREAVRLANLDLIGLPADEALTRIGTDLKGFEPFEKAEDPCIYVGQVCVRLDEDRVVVGIGTD